MRNHFSVLCSILLLASSSFIYANQDDYDHGDEPTEATSVVDSMSLSLDAQIAILGGRVDALGESVGALGARVDVLEVKVDGLTDAAKVNHQTLLSIEGAVSGMVDQVVSLKTDIKGRCYKEQLTPELLAKLNNQQMVFKVHHMTRGEITCVRVKVNGNIAYLDSDGYIVPSNMVASSRQVLVSNPIDLFLPGAQVAQDGPRPEMEGEEPSQPAPQVVKVSPTPAPTQQVVRQAPIYHQPQYVQQRAQQPIHYIGGNGGYPAPQPYYGYSGGQSCSNGSCGGQPQNYSAPMYGGGRSFGFGRR